MHGLLEHPSRPHYAGGLGYRTESPEEQAPSDQDGRTEQVFRPCVLRRLRLQHGAAPGTYHVRQLQSLHLPHLQEGLGSLHGPLY